MDDQAGMEAGSMIAGFLCFGLGIIFTVAAIYLLRWIAFWDIDHLDEDDCRHHISMLAWRLCVKLSIKLPEYKRPIVEEMNRWDDDLPNEQQKWFRITEIVVPSEEDKEQLLLASQYIHDSHDLDTDYMAVNYVAHIYTDPELIRVRRPHVTSDSARYKPSDDEL